ncbi:prolyl oligopeptidase family serine peptidase [Flammeovirga sp. MY04]|uniref:alpha/beta hydrolase family protein n=1 Tax=Flammeovirga sp. MY04 TaxID=1191459 RepID=UPI000806269D|nr:acetylxylan esterase [Flammeovirga sp. MY04]ANQ51726.1 prolyl oligopeptidase family serine peptidase [Flammeovirga sp. MY04]
MKKIFLLFLFLPIFALAQKESIWDLEELYKTPKYEETDIVNKKGVKSIFYESIDYKGKPTKVYAYYNIPTTKKPENGYPAIVLVHGGGGTAFEDWVKIWNKRGYVAISMDLEGHLPSKNHQDRKNFEGSGPSRHGVFHDNNEALQDQWYYQAVAQVILAHSFLRGLPEVDTNNIGITGVSWGGMLTSSIAGIDDRFKFAIPIYGCGFLNGTDGLMGQHFKNGNQAYRDSLLTNFEAEAYLPKATMPILFINGSNDAHFPIPAMMSSAKAPKSKTYLYVEDGLGHGHPPAWDVEESYRFANAIIHNLPLMDIQKTTWDRSKMDFSAVVKGVSPRKVTAYYTFDKGKWQKRRWHSTPGNVKGTKMNAPIPEEATAAYLIIRDVKGMSLTTEVLFSASDKQTMK